MNRAETLQQLAQLCRSSRSLEVVEPSGCAELDRVLPGGGWQSGTLVELLPVQTGIGELRLLMPALARITHSGRYAALIAPPYIPFAPALAQHGIRLDRLLVIHAQRANDILWACEQTLRCRSFGAALAWPATIDDRQTRRLQLAAEAGRSVGFLYRSPEAALHTSPAAVRLKLSRHPSGTLQIDLLKCRGARSGISLAVASR